MSFDCERFIQILLIARREAQHRRIRRVDRLIEGEHRFIAPLTLRQHGRAGCQAAQQNPEEQHRQRDAEQRGKHERPQNIVETVFEADKEVLIALLRKPDARFKNHILRHHRLFHAGQQASHRFIRLKLAVAWPAQRNMYLEPFSIGGCNHRVDERTH